LTLEELKSKGLNTVIFVDGEEKISQRMNLEIETIIAEMENPTAEMIISLQTDRRLKRDYFDESIIENILINYNPLNDSRTLDIPTNQVANFKGDIAIKDPSIEHQVIIGRHEENKRLYVYYNPIISRITLLLEIVMLIKII